MTETLSHAPAAALPVHGRDPASSGIDEALIEQLVRGIYARIRSDAVLGPIFADVIPQDWEPHLQTMMDFWSSVMLKSGRFKGRPMEKHQALHMVRPQHFERWLNLFRECTEELCPPHIGPLFVRRAELIAESLQRGMFSQGAMTATAKD